MPRDDRGPSHEPGRAARAGDPAGARTPPARPDERGTGEERGARIGSSMDERTTRREDRPRGTAADTPERGGEEGPSGS